MELEITSKILLAGFVIAFVVGAVANKTNFCTLGAISDWVNMGDVGRLGAWLLAIATALLGVMALQAGGLVDMSMTASGDTSQPPYRMPLFVWPRYLLGGLLFGIGMTLASGCGNKTVLRLGAGNLKSLVVLLTMGAAAYVMMFTNFSYYAFLQWMNPVAINFADYGIESQDLGSLLGGLFGAEEASAWQTGVAAVLGVAALWFAFRSRETRGSLDNLLGGIVIGLAIVALWYITAGDLGQTWLEEIDWMDVKPLATGAQSVTFVAPSGQLIHFLVSGGGSHLVTLSMACLAGIMVGSLVFAVLAGNFRIEWFANLRDFVNHLFGATLMGIGGVLGLGCTFGQGITGVSTLAAGSFLTLAAIVFGSTLTMKVQYYRIAYEEEAGFVTALVASLADLHMLPNSWRRLEAL